MKFTALKRFFTKLLLILQILQIFTPHALLHASPQVNPAATSQDTAQIRHDLGLPSRKAFREVSESWEGLRPAAYIKNSNSKLSTDSSVDSITQLVGAQKSALTLNKKNKALTEALEYLNNLAAPGKAIENLNGTKRMMSDMQMFEEKGLFKAFNRTILSMGKVLQMTQFYEGASSKAVVEQRRDFITGLLKTPEAARAISLRIRCFGKYENQFLRQTSTPCNESLEEKIQELEPSKIFGKLRNNPTFIRWHSRLLQTRPWEGLKASYGASSAIIILILFLRSCVSYLKNNYTPSLPAPKMPTMPAQQAQPLGTSELIAAQTTAVIKAELHSELKPLALKFFNETIGYSASTKLQLLRHILEIFFGGEKRREISGNALKSAFQENASKVGYDLAVGPFNGLFGLIKLLCNVKKTDTYLKTLYSEEQWDFHRQIKELTEQRKNTADPDARKRLNEEIQKLQDDAAANLKVPSNELLEALNESKSLPSIKMDTWVELSDFVENFSDAAAHKIRECVQGTDTEKLNAYIFDGEPKDIATKDVLSALGAVLNPVTNMAEIIDDTQASMKNAENYLASQTGNNHLLAHVKNFFFAPFRNLGAFTENASGGHVGTGFATNIFSFLAILRGNIPHLDMINFMFSPRNAIFGPIRRMTKLTGSLGNLAIGKSLSEKLTKKIEFTASDGKNYLIKLQPWFSQIINGAEEFLTKWQIPQQPFISVAEVTKDPAGKEKLEYLNRAKIEEHRLMNEIKNKILEKLPDIRAGQKKTKKKTSNTEARNPNSVIAGITTEIYISGFCLLAAMAYMLLSLKVNEKQMIMDQLDDHMFFTVKPAIALAEMVRQMSCVLNTHKATVPLPASLQNKLTMLLKTATPNCKEFSQLAQNKMFLKADKPLLFGDYGTLRYAYKLSGKTDVKKWLGTCAAFMAEIDSYLAIARLVAEHKDAPNYFYPVTFVDQDKPLIDLKDYWFPIISAYKSIPNTICIGDPAHILITGLNGGGKSFALKGLVFTILMSHAFGYGPLRGGKMTFFPRIITHLSTADNAAEGDSCWIAEAKSMGNAIHAMQAPYESGDFILYIGDELGSGTASHASVQAVAQFMEVALDQHHVASIISTHLRPLTELEFISNGKVHNYRVGGTVADDGTIQRKYRLERGRAELNIAELIVNQLLENGEQKMAPAIAA